MRVRHPRGKDGDEAVHFPVGKAEEAEANMAIINKIFGDIGVAIAPRVMSLAEAYA